MGTLVLNGATSGSTTIQPTDAVTVTATFPNATGTVMVSGNMPAFSAYQSSAQTLSSVTYTKLQFQTKIFDTNNAFDNTTNYRFQPTIAGYYQINACFYVSTTATTLNLSIYKNGSEYQRFAQSASAAAAVMGSGLVYLNGSTDYIEMYGYAIVGQALSAGQTFTYFNGSMVRAA